MFICWILKIKEFLLGELEVLQTRYPTKYFKSSCIAQHSQMVKSKDFERPKSDTGVRMGGGDFVHALSYSRTSTWRLIVQG